VVATRIVPDLRWGVVSFSRARFVRTLLELESTRFTSKLPSVKLPLKRDFAFGEPAMTVDSGQIDTGNGSWMRGKISYPATATNGRFIVKNILFLKNGIHIFSVIEDL
jgi:hypothetical protein